MTPPKSLQRAIIQLQTTIDGAILEVITSKLPSSSPIARNSAPNMTYFSSQIKGVRSKSSSRVKDDLAKPFFEVYAQPTNFFCDGENR